MNKLKILHSADLHMDSPFEGLPGGIAALRRGEQRELLNALAALANREAVDAVLLSGDLLDSDNAYYETGDALARSLESIKAPVFIAPGNHDFYTTRSPYAKLKLPQNVHMFTKNDIECAEVEGLCARVYGAAFTDRSSLPLLRDFHADRAEGMYNLMCIHGELAGPECPYNPISEAELAQSGMDYVALGHTHKAGGLRRSGQTWYSWPGCPEGRGFDETGEKTVSIVELEGENCSLRPVCIATRRYEILTVDVSQGDPLLSVHAALPGDTVRNVYRIVLTGETDAPPNLSRLHRELDGLFLRLQIKDKTRLRRSVWESAGEDTLRGLFLKKLLDIRAAAQSDEERDAAEQAARWGLAALDNMEEVCRHDD